MNMKLLGLIQQVNILCPRGENAVGSVIYGGLVRHLIKKCFGPCEFVSRLVDTAKQKVIVTFCFFVSEPKRPKRLRALPAADSAARTASEKVIFIRILPKSNCRCFYFIPVNHILYCGSLSPVFSAFSGPKKDDEGGNGHEFGNCDIFGILQRDFLIFFFRQTAPLAAEDLSAACGEQSFGCGADRAP